MKPILVVSLAALALAVPFAVSAETAAKPAAKAAAYKAPRNALGQPDLEGNWTNATMTGQARPAQYGGRLIMTPQEVAKLESANASQIAAGNQSTDPNAPPPTEGGVGGYNRGWLDPGSSVMRVGGQPRTSILTTPDGQIPRRKGQAAPAPVAARAAPAGAPATGGAFTVDRFGSAYIPGERDLGAASGQYDNPEQRPLGERCLISFGRNGGPPMFPNGFYNNNYQFVQGKDEVAIMAEMVHDVRHVQLNTRQHRTDGVRPWFGDSIGWYEGDTLVVETTNIPQRQAYAGSWENLKVTERFKRVGKDRLLYQFTIDDPSLWDKPWGGEYEFADLHGQLHEYACHEGNYAMDGILAGARAEEAAAAGKRAAAK